MTTAFVSESNKLDEIIANLRTEMFNIAASKGLCHKDTVKVSQRLDEYINMAQNNQKVAH